MKIRMAKNRCSFCGKSNGEATIFIQAEEACICDKCVLSCLDVIKEELSSAIECLEVVSNN